MRLNKIDWVEQVVAPAQALWQDAYEQLERDLKIIPWLDRLAGGFVRRISLPRAFRQEIDEVAAFLEVDPKVVLAAQMVYDEGWAAEALSPRHGCTSVSTPDYFGRNLDYAYPDNAEDYVFQQDIEVAGKSLFIEGFAGLLSWLAYRGHDSAATFNQAPCLRKQSRLGAPTLLWFRQMSLGLEAMDEYNIPEGGVTKKEPTAGDCLIHAQKCDRRFLVETFGKDMVWEERDGTITQANTYQVFDLPADPSWELDSHQRMRAAGNASSLREALRAASNDCTCDSVCLLPAMGAI